MALPIIIAGAGAAGLLAAYRLSSAGFPVIVLEADLRPGGRIRTRPGHGFSHPVESGAEFVHGDLPLTLGLLQEAGIPYHPVGGKMIRVKGGNWIKESFFTEDWDELLQKMGQLRQDMPLAAFLDQYFPGDRYSQVRSSVRTYAEGYDLADITTASTMAVHTEWTAEEGPQYRIDGGYGRLIQYLVDQCKAQGCILHFSSPVQDIRWERGRVEISTSGDRSFTGSRLIVTAPLGILQQGAIPPFTPGPESYALRFSPAIPDYLLAARQMGYGAVIKILLEFSTAFWEEGVGFIISDEQIPTWWTQSPDRTPLLTGWLTGEAMRSFQLLDEEARIQRCLSSLSSIFSRTVSFLKDQLVACHISDWSQAPFINGGYSFETVDSAAARKLLRQPLEDTVFFSGEALHDGSSPATVEAAFHAGNETAEKIIAQS